MKTISLFTFFFIFSIKSFSQMTGGNYSPNVKVNSENKNYKKKYISILSGAGTSFGNGIGFNIGVELGNEEFAIIPNVGSSIIFNPNLSSNFNSNSIITSLGLRIYADAYYSSIIFGIVAADELDNYYEQIPVSGFSFMFGKTLYFDKSRRIGFMAGSGFSVDSDAAFRWEYEIGFHFRI